MAVERVVLTYNDYLAMPDDGRRYEILDGEVAVSAIYVDTDRAGLVTDRGIRGGPALAIEVLSPSTATSDRGPKFQMALPPFPDLALDLDELWRG
jgi:hypothetical protein